MNTAIAAEVVKFKALRKQLEVHPGHIPGVLMSITCPWCDSENVEGQKFCCDPLRRAIQLIMSEPPAKEFNA
jgi:hypothetical protein